MPTSPHRQRLPPGGSCRAATEGGNRSAEPEKTVKRSSRRRGVNLQFFPVEPTALGLSRASSPGPVAGWVESRGREGGVGTPLPTSGPSGASQPVGGRQKAPPAAPLQMPPAFTPLCKNAPYRLPLHRHSISVEAAALREAANPLRQGLRRATSPGAGESFPQGGKAFGKTANFTAPPKAPPRGELSRSD